jgi:hypothetical protein
MLEVAIALLMKVNDHSHNLTAANTHSVYFLALCKEINASGTRRIRARGFPIVKEIIGIGTRRCFGPRLDPVNCFELSQPENSLRKSSTAQNNSVVVHLVRRFAEIIPTDTLMVRLPELALGMQHFQIHLWSKQFDLSHYQ